MVERVGAHAVVTGGPSRQASVRAALAAIPADAQTVAVHDAARPLARPRLFDDVVDTLDAMPEAAGVVPVVAIADTVKRIRDGFVIGTEARDELALAQTPQAFRTGPLRDAHERAAAEDVAFTDDAALVAWAGGRVAVVPGDLENFKVTSADDLRRAEFLLARASHG
jgi:2-C-methyl-D-erythritol 4-phosphate cytidylyltransferase